jgi:hypothetical protein
VGEYSFETNKEWIQKPNCRERGGGGLPGRNLKIAVKMVVSAGIFRVCFAQFLCGYSVLIKQKVNIEIQICKNQT